MGTDSLENGKKTMDRSKIEQAVKMILEAIGENPDREGLKETPLRVARMYEEIFSGLREDPELHLQKFFSEDHDEMVIVKDIPLYSMCEHHLLPFYGRPMSLIFRERAMLPGCRSWPGWWRALPNGLSCRNA